MRWAQLTLAENDPGQYDLHFWLDYFSAPIATPPASAPAVAWPITPPKSRCIIRSQWMKDKRSLRRPGGRLPQTEHGGAGAHRPARVSPGRLRRSPDWIAVQADGKKRPHWVMPGWWVTCALGPYNFEFMTAARADRDPVPPDGIFSNRLGGVGHVATASTAENFKTATGFDLPRTLDPQNPGARRLHRMEAAAAVRTLRGVEPGYSRDQPRRLVHSQLRRRRAERAGYEDHRRTGAGDLCRPPGAQRALGALVERKNAKEYRANHGIEARGRVVQRGRGRALPLERFGCRPRRNPPLGAGRHRQRAAAWFSKFCGTLYDKRWLPVVEKLYDWHFRNERYLRNVAPLARVGMVYSQQTAQYYGGERARQKVKTTPWLLPGADRGAHPLRDGA